MASTPPPTPRSRSTDKLRNILLDLNRAKTFQDRLTALARVRPNDVVPEIPRNAEPRTRKSMGDHAALTALEWGITREAQDELAYRSHINLAAAYDRGFQDDLITPYPGLERDQNLRARHHAGEAGHAQAGLRQG